MFLSWSAALLGICGAAAAVPPAGEIPSKINAFILSLPGLPPTQVRALTSTYSASSDVVGYMSGKPYSQNALTSLACFTAQFVLGNDSVGIPVSAQEADDNWSTAVWQIPSCAIIPNNEQDVSTAVKIISFLHVKFAIRSGGHSPSPGFSTIGQPGILIDMQKLNQIALSADHSTVTLGPGARWGDVYAALDQYDLGVIGGRLPNVGVGGLILGGGYFHFSAMYGLAADNVKNFELVLANGTVMNASVTENPDLYWALKGGGPNFGIVTRFEVNSVPVRNIWYNVSVYPNSQVPAIFDAMTEWQENGAIDDTLGTVALIVGLETTEVGLLYAQPTYRPDSFTPFYGLAAGTVVIPPTNGTLAEVTTILGESQSQLTERHDYRAASSKIDAQLYKDVYNVWQQQASAVYNATGANQTFTIQPWPASLAAASKSRGGNAMGIPIGSFQAWTTLIDWTNAVQDEQVRAVSINTVNTWTSLAQKRGLYESFLFMNDCSREQNPLAGYGSANLAKLKSVAMKYDPTGFFQNLQNNGFLLSKA
ncbi:MAG: hypothetical protein Q9157_001552 [Trypethelium eluteriae]